MQELHQNQQDNNIQDDASGSEDSSYKFPAYEKHLVHASIEMPQFDQFTGAKQSTPMVQKYTTQEFKNQMATNGFAGYKVEVLHDPSKTGKIQDGIVSQTAGGQSLGDRHHPDSLSRLAAGDTTVTKEEVAAELTKSVNKAGKPELQERYTQLYGEKPEEAMTVADLKKAIKEKVEFLEQENADKAAAAEATKQGASGTGAGTPSQVDAGKADPDGGSLEDALKD